MRGERLTPRTYKSCNSTTEANPVSYVSNYCRMQRYRLELTNDWFVKAKERVQVVSTFSHSIPPRRRNLYQARNVLPNLVIRHIKSRERYTRY